MRFRKKTVVSATWRIACFALTCLMLLLEMSVFSYAATGVSAKKAASRVLESGVYRIRNVKTGLYIDVYDFIYDTDGSAYLNKKSGETAQDIYAERLEDGTYRLYPQSDGTGYALSCKNGMDSGSTVTKEKNVSKTECFDIYPSGSDYFTVSPAYSKGNKVALGVLSDKSKYDDRLLGLEKYSTTSKSQLWVFEPVTATGISLAYTETKVRLYSVGTLYATLTPYNYGAHNVKWQSSNEKVLMIDSNGSYCALTPGEVKVTATCDGKRTSCIITVSSNSAFTWYSQHNISTSDWSGDALSEIYFSAGGVRKRFAIDRYEKGLDWLDDGCYLCSIAMVLKNLGATLTKGYDFRSGQSGDLPADPYTVALANSGNNGATSQKAVLYGNPIMVNRVNIESRFNVAGRKVCSEVSLDVSKKAIKEALDAHPEGVIVYFANSAKNRSHYIVFTECVNPEADPSDYRFRVCDSAAYDAARGEHVMFEDCISYTSQGYRMSNAVNIMTWNVK